MATTSSTLATSKAITGRRGDSNGKRNGLLAKLAAGAGILACAAALTLGGLRATDRAQAPSVAPAIAQTRLSGTDRQHFLAANLELPSGTVAPISYERQRFLEQNLYFPVGGAISSEALRFLEWNTQLPTSGAADIPASSTSALR